MASYGQQQVAPSASSHSKLSFQSLPAELRNQIYTYSLVQSTPIHLPYAYQTSTSFQEPSLLLTCKSIRAEATPIFYGSNIFEAPSPAAAQRFLTGLQREKIAQLRLFRPLDLVLPLDDVLKGAMLGPAAALSDQHPQPYGVEGDGAEAEAEGETTLPHPPPSPAVAISAASQRWIDVICMNINRLVEQCGKGALSAEAVSVPIRRRNGELVWLKVKDVKQFQLVQTLLADDSEMDREEVREVEGEGEAAASSKIEQVATTTTKAKRLSWRIEWKDDC